jgi:hypothetical protein
LKASLQKSKIKTKKMIIESLSTDGEVNEVSMLDEKNILNNMV